MALAFGSGLVAAPALATDAPPAPDAVLARVGGTTITVKQFTAEMARRGLTGELATPRYREALLDDMIRLEVLAQAARAAGYEKDPAVVLAMNRLLADKYAREKLAPAAAAVAVTDEEAQRYYDQHAADYGAGEKRQAAILFFRVPGTADADAKKKIRERAEKAAAEAAKLPAATAAFGPLAARLSEDAATRYQGGDVGWLTAKGDYRFGAAVRDAAFALGAAGQVSTVVEGTGGLYVVKLIGVQKGEAVPFAAAKATIARRLAQEKTEALERAAYEKLRAGAAVKVEAGLLQSVVAPAGAQNDGPPALP